MTDRTPFAPALPAMLDALMRANIGYIVLGYRDGKFEKLDATDAAMRHLGWSRQAWLDRPMFATIAPDQRDVTEQLYRRIISGEALPPTFELVTLDANGQAVSLEVSYGCAEVPGGHVLAMIWSDQPHHAPPQLSTLEADRVALVGALAAGFAHEINNPLTSVLLNLRSLRKLVVTNLADAKQAAALRVLDDIAAGAERIASNVRAFQTLASRGRSQPLDLGAVVTAVLRLAMPTLEPRAQVTRTIAATRPVLGEESRFAQAVLAMLLFAGSGFATGEADHLIEILVEERGERTVVEVSDNGAALQPDELGHVFDPFFRPEARSAGLGGGLAAARSVALSSGGDVAIAARPGGGVVITMALPFAGGAAIAAI